MVGGFVPHMASVGASSARAEVCLLDSAVAELSRAKTTWDELQTLALVWQNHFPI